MVQKRFSQKDQSPCHHQTPQTLFSLLPLSSQLGQQWWRGQDLLLLQLQLLGQVHQPLLWKWGFWCWHWLGPLQISLARKVQHLHWLFSKDIDLILCDPYLIHHLILVQDEGPVDAGEAILWVSACRCRRPGASHLMKWEPNPNLALVSWKDWTLQPQLRKEAGVFFSDITLVNSFLTLNSQS